MKTRFVLALVLVVAACGDNLRATGGSDGGAIDAPPDGTTSVCGDGVVSGTEQCESGACCANCMFTAFGTACRAAAGACDAAEQCDGLSAACPADANLADGTPCATGFCAGGQCADCDPAIDADFDGFNQCVDCDDTNGLVYPRANEQACEGLDDDCDGKIDEDWDQDGDGYSTCSTDPLIADCDDTQATTYPGAPELCGPNGTGNGRDDNCNGYVDETCAPCSTADLDGDGVSECQGDCDDTRPGVNPMMAEACDGLDTDCNTFTTENCDVSDRCNWPGNADVCKDDLQCGCVVNAQGQCTGDYRCASFCQSSYTGPIGAGCTATQTCAYRWTNSDNQHACAETTATLGTKLGGETCTTSTECRSGDCDFICTGPGCNVRRCIDFCDHHAPGMPGSCAAGTTCEIVSASAVSTFMYATCAIADNGTRTTGQSCSAVNGCVWGTQACVSGTCAQPCGEEAHCPTGTHCSMRGNRVTTGTWGAGTPVGVTGQSSIETVPVCLADSAGGAHDRRGGAACSANSQCVSNFCAEGLGVCVDPCVSDASCAVGLTCEPLYIRPAPGAGVFWGRACVNASFGDFLSSM